MTHSEQVRRNCHNTRPDDETDEQFEKRFRLEWKRIRDEDVWRFKIAASARSAVEFGRYAHILRCRYGYKYDELHEMSGVLELAEFDELLDAPEINEASYYF
jgi:hypothetical protein